MYTSKKFETYEIQIKMSESVRSLRGITYSQKQRVNNTVCKMIRKKNYTESLWRAKNTAIFAYFICQKWSSTFTEADFYISGHI